MLNGTLKIHRNELESLMTFHRNGGHIGLRGKLAHCDES